MYQNEPMPEPCDQLGMEQAEMNSDESYQQWLDEYDKETKKMKLKVSESSGFKQAPIGNHIAVCNAVISLGNQVGEWQGTKKVQPKVYIRWELPNERIEYEKDGEKHEGPMSVGKTYTASLATKANLYKDLISWRGKPFSEEEAEGFELFTIVGAPCMLNVVHNESNGKTYANIASIAPLPKGADKPKLENDPIKYDEENEGDWDHLPEWLQEKIGQQVDGEVLESNEPPADFDDSIPF